MKKIIIMLMMLLLFPITMNAETTAPSITAKPVPKIIETEPDNVLITSYLDRANIDQSIDLQTRMDIENNLSTAYEAFTTTTSVISGLKYNDDSSLVVSDLFDITLLSGNKMTITFDLDLKNEDETPIFVYREVNDNWKIAKVNRNIDNTLTVDFDGFGTIAIIKVNSAHFVPETNDSMIVYFATAAIIAAAITIPIIIIKRKTKND